MIFLTFFLNFSLFETKASYEFTNSKVLRVREANVYVQKLYFFRFPYVSSFKMLNGSESAPES